MARATGAEPHGNRRFRRRPRCEVSPGRTVCIRPDGPLWELPVEALLAPDGRFFVEHTAPFYAPSIAVYARMRGAGRRPVGGTLFALADPTSAPTAAVGPRAGERSPLPD